MNILFFIFFVFFLGLPAHAVFEPLNQKDIQGITEYQQSVIDFLVNNPKVKRHSLVKIEQSEIEQMAMTGRMEIPLFDGKIFSGQVTYKRRFYPSGTMFSGWLQNTSNGITTNGQFTYTSYENYVAFVFHNEKLTYSVRGVAGSLHVLLEIDPRKYKGCGGIKHAKVTSDPKKDYYNLKNNASRAIPMRERDTVRDLGWEDDAVIDNGQVLDILMVYASSTSTLSPDIEGQLRVAIALANTAYLASNVHMRWRLVDTHEFNHNEAAAQATELGRLETQGDGFMDDVHDLRAEFGADAVAQMSAVATDNCGLANFNTTLPPSITVAFSVTDISCITNFTTTHEIGHNLGLNHDSGGMKLYSNGFANAGAGVRTVMNTNGCCNRINFLSNPRVKAAGNVIGTITANDSSRHLNEVAAEYAAVVKGKKIDHLDPEEDHIINNTCFIATATYGSPIHPHVMQFKKFRDQFLTKFEWGKLFIRTYYKYSPPYAEIIANNPTLKNISWVLLTPLAVLLKYPWLGLALLFFPIGLVLNFTKRNKFD